MKKEKNRKIKFDIKEIKSYIIKYKNKTVHFLKKVKKEHLISKYCKNNILFFTYLFTCLINSTMLRFFTMHTMENYLAFKPILADLAILTIVGSFAYLFKPKNRFKYLLVIEIFFTAICMINSIYYTFYTSFASVSMLSLTQYIGEVGDAVTENVLELKDLLYVFGPLLLIFVNFKLKKNGYFNKVIIKKERKRQTLTTLIVGCVLAVIFTVTLSSLEIGRFAKQWNREYVVMRFGIYVYQFNDAFVSLQPKLNSLFGYDNAMKEFKEYFADKPEEATNEYTNIFEGKNVIAIHGESIQNFLLNLKFNGQEVTPTLNKLSKEGMYFSNFYSQVSVGTSSDSEFTYNTSLMPAQSGTAFVSYFDRKYYAIPQFLTEKGYYTFSMHGNTADFWNRRIMHQNLGYQKFYSKETYDVNKENTIGLGISDKEFFKQSIEKLKKIKEKGKPFYGLLITLTNHTPFSDVEKYGEFDVDIKNGGLVDEETGQPIPSPYMEGTKLGNYFKSAHYADAALGEFIQALQDNGLMENTIFLLYGDHDARLPKKDYNRLYNYDAATDTVKTEEDEGYVNFDDYQYELNRKVPFIIWDPNMKGTKLNKEITNVMGMYDVTPTLGNMLGFKNKYALGHDIFNIKENNIVVFPNGNWVTNNVYYNSQKGEYLTLKETAISEDYIEKNNEYSEKLLRVSDDIIVFDLFKKLSEQEADAFAKEGE